MLVIPVSFIENTYIERYYESVHLRCIQGNFFKLETNAISINVVVY